ncbi:hypothetical protein [Gorillibacterium sp. CAU 1737]|uniref:hypothetical protein n=1 Tax=Gorillibacterium sp. CAU 1737 TaxID=3140362 RepID=UPI003261B280
MKNRASKVGKSTAIALAFTLVAGSAALLTGGIRAVQAEQESRVITVLEKQPQTVVPVEGRLLTQGVATAKENRVFTIADFVVPKAKTKKGNGPGYVPTAKDLGRDEAADRMAEKITALTGDKLDGYTATMMVYLLKERSTWLGHFESRDKKNSYRVLLDAVTGKVWEIDQTKNTGPEEKGYSGPNSSENEILLEDSEAVFGYNLRESDPIFKE